MYSHRRFHGAPKSCGARPGLLARLRADARERRRRRSDLDAKWRRESKRRGRQGAVAVARTSETAALRAPRARRNTAHAAVAIEARPADCTEGFAGRYVRA